MTGSLLRLPNWLGDAVMSLPAVGSMLRADPGATLWVHPRISGLAEVFFPGAHRLLTDARLPRGRFTSAVLFTGSFRSALHAFLSGIPARIGWPGDMRSLLLTSKVPLIPGRARHHSLDFIDVAVAAGASPEDAVMPDSHGLPEGEPHVALFTGARFGRAKEWGGFTELGAMLTASTGLPVRLYGPETERESIESMVDSIPGAISSVGLRLPLLAARMRQARLAVGNDSGGAHLAAALGVPTVTLFGSTSPVWTAPLGARTSVVYSGFSCSPCYRQVCNRGETPCLGSITAEDVFDQCMGLLVDEGSP